MNVTKEQLEKIIELSIMFCINQLESQGIIVGISYGDDIIDNIISEALKDQEIFPSQA